MVIHNVIAAAIAASITLPIAYTVFNREPCVELLPIGKTETGQPIYYKVETPAVFPGDKIKWLILIKRNAACEYRRTSFMIDGANEVRTYDPVDLGTDGSVTDGKEYLLSEIVPLGAYPGEAEYFRFGHYRRSLVNDYWPLPPVQLAHFRFTILEPEEKPK